MNSVNLMGRLTRDPELKQTQSGISVCRFSVAVNRPFVNKETNEREADFIECEAWRQTAEFVCRYFQKGAMIAVEGSLRNNNYEDANGVKHYGMKVAVNQVHFCGSKNDGQNGGGQATQQSTYAAAGTPAQQQSRPAAPAQQRPPQAAQPQSSPLGDLSEFEDILSDGELPF